MFDDVFYPPPAFHFRVDFLLFPSPSGYSFKEISGIEAKMDVTTIVEGGENMYEHRVPGRTTYENLVLKRGFVDNMASPLVAWIMSSMNSGFLLPILPQNIFVSLLGDSGTPIAAWSFADCYPVRWDVGDFDSENTDSVLMEEIEFCYSSFTRIPAVAMKALTGAVGLAGDIVEKVADSEAVKAVSGLVTESVDAAEEIVEASLERAADEIVDGVESGMDALDEALVDEIDDVNALTEAIKKGTEETVEDIKKDDEEESEEESSEEETEEETEEESSDSESDTEEALGPDNTGIGSGGGGDDDSEDEDEDEEESSKDDDSTKK